jgi:hypothetical protein
MTTHANRRAALAAVGAAGYAADLDTAVTLPIEASCSRLARLFHR